MQKTKLSFIKIFNEKRITTVAGAWVYYFLTSLIPMLFLIITAFSVFGVSISKDVVSRLPVEFRLAGETVLQTAENASKGATIFFVVTVIFSCTSLLNQMSKDGDYIYEAQSRSKRGLMRRLWAVLAIGALFVLFLGLAFLFAFSSSFKIEWYIPKNEHVFLSIFIFLLAIAFGYAIIYVLNKFICPIKCKFPDLALGTLVALAIMVLGTLGFTVYLKFFSNYNAFYGALSGVIIFLFWAYILMFGLSVGAVVNVGVYRYRQRESKNTKRSGENGTSQKRNGLTSNPKPKKVISKGGAGS